MKTLKFKTNIKCGGCLATVTPHLNNESSIQQWHVDTNNSDKVLTVSGEDVNPQQIENAVKNAGFKAELMQVYATNGSSL